MRPQSCLGLLIGLVCVILTGADESSADLNTVLLVENIIEINRILWNESFFRNVSKRVDDSSSDRCTLSIHFRFTLTLVDLLVKFSASLVEVSLRSYAETSRPGDEISISQTTTKAHLVHHTAEILGKI